jgi:head-tail adaptor
MPNSRVRPGRLRHRVQIQRLAVRQTLNALGETTAKDGTGLPEWTTVAPRYADVIAISGAEPFQGQQISPDVTHRIEMRSFVPGDGTRFTPAWRILWGSRIFNLISILNPGEQAQGTLMQLACKEEVPKIVSTVT